MRSLLLLLLLPAAFPVADDTGLPPGVKNTQNPKDVPPTPDEAVKSFKLPEGFNVTLFAGEPHVLQPISMAFDDRGRLWVAECFSYPAWVKESPRGKDRILILEDTDGDGKFDKRTVFWDKGDNLTSLVIGHGGVWALCAPHLLFFPDKDGDGKPFTGKPQIVLDGWETDKTRHNLVNGLTWGPDGWLYGCHGIVAESKPGVPGTDDDKRVRINCGIWRYHPTRKIVEAVCHGTTNPWGLDFDENGEGWFTNCVIGHLWHVIPGAHYKRMYGQAYNKYAYELIDATSEHLHWAGGSWTDSRGGKGAHGDAGGGHAHVGCMVYQGDMFPKEYKNGVFMCNLHGNRLNIDRIERKGNSYVGKRGPDFLMRSNAWFRGTSVISGPDGAVYVSDWCDLGECHDHDGTHRSSGRIYKVTYGKPKPMEKFDLRKKTDLELIDLLFHLNDWFARRARVLLAERAADRSLSDAGRERLLSFPQKNVPEKTEKNILRAIWAKHVTGLLEPQDLRYQVSFKAPVREHLQAGALRLLCSDYPIGQSELELLKAGATLGLRASGTPLLRLQIASALQRLPLKDRFLIAETLARHAGDAEDRCQSLLIWYGIEPAVLAHPHQALRLVMSAKMPKLRQFIARRLSEGAKPEMLEIVGRGLHETTPEVQRDLLQGILDALKGIRSVKQPKSWDDVYPTLSKSESSEVRRLSALLAVQFDDPKAIEALNVQLVDPRAAAGDRVIALQALVAKGTDLSPQLFKLLDDKAVRGPVLRSLATYRHADTPKHILRIYSSLSDGEKQDALSTLASRKEYALALLDAVENKQIARGDVTPFTARQIQGLKDKALETRLEKVWGSLRRTPAEKQAQIRKYKDMLTTEVMKKADPSAGRVVFSKTCAQCHKLFGEGHAIGPDLTGSQRFNLDYVLENSVDPSAAIGNDYRLTNVVTAKGRLISGIVVEESDRALTLQTATEKVVVPKNEIEDRSTPNVSMMPEGQLEKMTREELRDLVAYLAVRQQVPLPKEK